MVETASSDAGGILYQMTLNIAYTFLKTATGTSISVTGSFISEEDMELIKNGGTPPGITVLDMSEGIEPFSFLDL